MLAGLKLRYRGTIKNDGWLNHRVAAVTLRRLIALFQVVIQSRMSFSRAWIERWAPRRTFLSVSNANHRYLIEPGGIGRGAVHVETRMSVKPFRPVRVLWVA